MLRSSLLGSGIGFLTVFVSLIALELVLCGRLLLSAVRTFLDFPVSVSRQAPLSVLSMVLYSWAPRVPLFYSIVLGPF